MEGNFLSRYQNKVDHWNHLIKTDPDNKKMYEREMSDYIIKCMPYMTQYADDDIDGGDEDINTNNVFNVKETVGLKRKDIFTDYLIKVEDKNLSRPYERVSDECDTCAYSNIIYFQIPQIWYVTDVARSWMFC